MSNTIPSLKTTSNPRMLFQRFPYFIKFIPPAFDATFPPIVQLPQAPKSKGVSKPYSQIDS